MVNLDHPFTSAKSLDETWEAILDLDRIVPCVQGGEVTERTSPTTADAQITVSMGAMSLRFVGTVEVTERDDDAHRAVLQVKSREANGSGYANADVTFTLSNGGGEIHTAAQITGKAGSMGEGVVKSVLDALIKDFTERLATI